MDNPFKNLSNGGKAAVAVGGAVVVYYAWKHKKSAGSAQDPIDPVTGLPTSQDNVTDPATGMTYLAEAEQYGSVSAAEAAVPSNLGGGAGSTGPVGTSQTLQPVTAVGGTTYASNSAWAQAAQSGLTDIGYTATDVSNALGLYLNSEPLTAAQASIVQAAIAEYGPPPVGSFKVILAPTTTPAGTPAPVGSHGALPAPTGVRVSNKNKHEFSLAWNPVHGAHNYRVKVSQLNNVVIADFQVPGPGATISANTHPGFTYHVGIQALPGGHGTNITVKLPSK